MVSELHTFRSVSLYFLTVAPRSHSPFGFLVGRLPSPNGCLRRLPRVRARRCPVRFVFDYSPANGGDVRRKRPAQERAPFQYWKGTGCRGPVSPPPPNPVGFTLLSRRRSPVAFTLLGSYERLSTEAPSRTGSSVSGPVRICYSPANGGDVRLQRPAQERAPFQYRKGTGIR